MAHLDSLRPEDERANDDRRRRWNGQGRSAANATVALDNARLLQRAQEEANRRRAAEDAATRLASIVESSDDAIVSKDLNGTVVSWNQGAQRLFGFTAKK